MRKLSFFLFAALCIAAVSISPLLFLWYDFALPDFYHENIGFRFFWTMRWVDGAPGDFIHPGQGVLLPFIQAAYYSVAQGDLWDRINTFANLTSIGGVASIAGVMLIIAVDRIPSRAKAALLLAPVFLAISHQHLFAYHLYPDYHIYAQALLTFVAWYFVREFVVGAPRLSSFVGLGILAGLAAALKINLGPLVLLLALANGTRQMAIIAGCASALVYGGLLAIYYRFRPGFITDYFIGLFNFAGNDWSFPWAELFPFASWHAHTMSNLGAALLLAAVLLAILYKSSARLAAVLAGITAFALLMAIRRGGGASYFDATVVTTLVCAIAISSPSMPPMPARAAITLMASSVVIWTLTSWPKLLNNNGLILQPATNWQRTLYDWNARHNLPILAIFPSNSFVVGSIEDMMMRGFSNFARVWYEANDNPSLHKLFPNHRFGSYDVKITRPAVVQWVEATESFPFPDDWRLHNERMRQIVGPNTGDCFEVRPPIAPFTIVHSCVVR